MRDFGFSMPAFFALRDGFKWEAFLAMVMIYGDGGKDKSGGGELV